jgi:hypothetical protein
MKPEVKDESMNFEERKYFENRKELEEANDVGL